MQVTIQPSILTGKIQAPASKSSMQRACAAALLKEGHTLIKNPGNSNDDKAALQIIRDLGVHSIDRLDNGDIVVISDGMNNNKSMINCGESGLSIRMFTPIAALSTKEITINGSGSLVTRPMNFFDEILPQLSVKIKSNNGKLPMVIQGPLQPGNIEVDGSLSSQFLTGLLMAYSAVDARGVYIKVKDLKSRPYIDLTLSVMKEFGMKIPHNRNYEEFYFEEAIHFYSSSSQEYTVEGDWSGGAFLLVAGAIAGDVIIKGLDINSTQADKAILKALTDAEVKMDMNQNEIKIKQSSLKAFQFEATDCPDLFPPLAALAAYCAGVTEIRGVQRLTHKESNRALTIQQELAKRNVEVELDGDIMRITGKKNIKAAVADSHHDHRIAMMNAVIGLNATGATILHDAQAVKKSYPKFFSDLKKLNANIEILESSFADAFEDWDF